MHWQATATSARPSRAVFRLSISCSCCHRVKRFSTRLSRLQERQKKRPHIRRYLRISGYPERISIPHPHLHNPSHDQVDRDTLGGRVARGQEQR
eukprot:365672-Chlamydomonas_euryale.AAC.10